MNHCVPDFNMEDVYSIPTSSNRAKKSPSMQDEDIMELLWHNGQLVMHSQTQHSKSLKNNKSPNKLADDAVLPIDQHEINPAHQPQHHHNNNHLFMQEDEMASWLHYPVLNDNNNNNSNFNVDSSDYCADLLSYNPNPTPCVTVDLRPPPDQSTKPPIPPPPSKSVPQNFANFSRHKAPVEVKESAVTSNDTPRELIRGGSRRSINYVPPGATISCGGGATAVTVGTSSNNAVGRDQVVDVTVTSSTDCSSSSGEPPTTHKLHPPQTAETRKRKGKDSTGDDGECQSEDFEFEPPDSKKQTRGSTSTKRGRAAEVHNLSERRRRDRINEKMKALQELIPRCNKSDKASMLDEAIEYLKSLQLQVQMMSMGCGMVPMIFPGVQQYMAPMGMGFGMGMGMDMGMARPMMPFPNALTGAALPSQTAAAHLNPRFPMPPFHMPTAPDSSTIHSDPLLNTLGMQNPNQPRIPNFQDPNQQQYMGLHPMQLPLQQHLTTAQPRTSKPISSKGAKNSDKQQ